MKNERQILEQRILNAANYWHEYDMRHGAYRSQERYLALNSQGEVLGRAGTVAEARMISNAATSVRHEDHLAIEQTIVEIRKRKLQIIQDFRDNAMIKTESIENTILGFENSSDVAEAEQQVNPTKSKGDAVDFELNIVPSMITHTSVKIPMRQQNFSYKESISLRAAIRRVTEKTHFAIVRGNEDIGVTHNGVSVTAYGLTTHPMRGTGVISDWTNSANFGVVHTELNAQIEQMRIAQNLSIARDSLMVYVANDIWATMGEDYKAGVIGTVYERCMKNTYIKDIKPLEDLPNGEVVIILMEPEYAQICEQSPIIAVPSLQVDVFTPQEFTIYGSHNLMIKFDRAGNSGVRHLSPP